MLRHGEEEKMIAILIERKYHGVLTKTYYIYCYNISSRRIRILTKKYVDRYYRVFSYYILVTNK